MRYSFCKLRSLVRTSSAVPTPSKSRTTRSLMVLTLMLRKLPEDRLEGSRPSRPSRKDPPMRVGDPLETEKMGGGLTEAFDSEGGRVNVPRGACRQSDRRRNEQRSGHRPLAHALIRTSLPHGR